MEPGIRFFRTPDSLRIAYGTTGNGPFLIFVPALFRCFRWKWVTLDLCPCRQRGSQFRRDKEADCRASQRGWSSQPDSSWQWIWDHALRYWRPHSCGFEPISGGRKRIQSRNQQVEKLGLYYVALAPHLANARQLREFAVRAIERVPASDDRIKHDHLFSPGDPENKAFWVQAQATAAGLVNSFAMLRD